MTQRTFILASSSPRRQQLLSELGIRFQVIKPEIDETQQPDEAPHAYVQRLSQEKAQAVADTLQEDVTILSADTVVILSADTIGIEANGAILGKPVDAGDARQMLQRLRERSHQVCTAFTLLQNGHSTTHMDCTTVTMRPYTDAEIDDYIATGDPFDKAGSYAIQHEGFHPVETIDGSYTNVMGLPMEKLHDALQALGWLS